MLHFLEILSTVPLLSVGLVLLLTGRGETSRNSNL